MDQISILVPSNKTVKTPHNKTNDFRVKLADSLRLKGGNWKVALHSITFPVSYVTLGHSGLKAARSVIFDTLEVLTYPSTHFDSTEDMISFLNSHSNGLIHFTIHDKKVRMKNSRKILYLGQELQYMLGFPQMDPMIELASDNHCPDFLPDPSLGVNHLYVYCDIVEPGIIGESKAKLLAVVPLRKKDQLGSIIYYEFRKPTFVPIKESEISSIHVNIRIGSGNPFPFHFGTVLLRLDFKNGPA